MRSVSVDSSVILSIGYDEKRQLLKVRFRNGRVYFYLAVPPESYEELMAARSVGKFFNEDIKPNFVAVRQRTVKRRR